MDVRADPITLFLCGDVMTGRGIDQVLPHPGDPVLYESYMRSALGYVQIADRANGPIGRRLDYTAIWGDALIEWERTQPVARIINLETAVTTSPHAWVKGINYRMHPGNLPCLTAAGIDICVLANNHVLDWGHDGLAETVRVLNEAGMSTVGAGADLAAAQRPAAMEIAEGRLLLFAFALPSSGVPAEWAATAVRSGVALLPNLSEASARHVAALCQEARRPGDRVVVSLHWGGNWGYPIATEQRTFAHRLVDAGVDLVHGHSSHHVKGIEVYNGKLILYGCGDFINDYEGIEGHEEYRDDLTLMYFPTLAPRDGRLLKLRMVPLQRHRFRLRRTDASDTAWLAMTLNREGLALGTRVIAADDGLLLQW